MLDNDLPNEYGLPVISQQPATDAIRKLKEVGENDIANELENNPVLDEGAVKSTGSGIFGFLKSAPKPWMYASHTIGFLPKTPKAGQEDQIQYAGEIDPDLSLKNSQIRINLNRLRVASYPGGGRHTVLLDFTAQNQVAGGNSEDVHFSSTFRAEDGAQAGVIGYPIFIGLGVGTTGVSFKCFTVNVKNDDDERLMNILDSETFKKGLTLATSLQPAIGPLSELALGITKSIASRNRNVPVQDIYLGLDFGGARLGARLAQGDYIAVQIPGDQLTSWEWSDWKYESKSGQIVNRKDGSNIPNNFIVFSVTKHE